MTWKGLVDGVSGATQLASGDYTLCVVVTDKDTNAYPGPEAGRTDNCQNFSIGPAPFLFEAQLRSVGQVEAFGGLKFRKRTMWCGQFLPLAAPAKKDDQHTIPAPAITSRPKNLGASIDRIQLPPRR
jgi:hypothetical protein